MAVSVSELCPQLQDARRTVATIAGIGKISCSGRFRFTTSKGCLACGGSLEFLQNNGTKITCHTCSQPFDLSDLVTRQSGIDAKASNLPVAPLSEPDPAWTLPEQVEATEVEPEPKKEAPDSTLSFAVEAEPEALFHPTVEVSGNTTIHLITETIMSNTAKVVNFPKIDSTPFVEFKNGLAVEPTFINWVWPGWLATGKLHLIGGAPGTNKTTIAVALGATLTIGGRWPDGTYCTKPQNLVIWSSEDDFEDTLLPRFIANGGDRSRLFYIHRVNHKGSVRAFNPKKDLPLLISQIEAIGNVGIVMIDSIADLSKGDSNNNTDTRNSLQPLVDAANKYNFAAIGVAHFNKGDENANPLNRIVGSVGFVGMARIVFACAVDPDEPINHRLLVRVKSNIGINHGGFRCVVKVDPLPGYPHIEAAHIEWIDELQGTAKELLGVDLFKDDKNQGKSDKAKDFLIKILSDVNMLRLDEVKRLADENNISERTLYRAKKSSGVFDVRGNGTTYWKLPILEGGDRVRGG